ncbi:MAG: hypothetical protein R3190_12570 [Thermoanaerobaculia bacterium]|nr:hypothetical protein [Thermoanaerobaculia bacterium]
MSGAKSGRGAADEGRRRLLKALTLGTGAVGLSAVPGKWIKPVAHLGTLPAHAQPSLPNPSECSCSIAVACSPDAVTSTSSLYFEPKVMSTPGVMTGRVEVYFDCCPEEGLIVKVGPHNLKEAQEPFVCSEDPGFNFPTASTNGLVIVLDGQEVQEGSISLGPETVTVHGADSEFEYCNLDIDLVESCAAES